MKKSSKRSDKTAKKKTPARPAPGSRNKRRRDVRSEASGPDLQASVRTTGEAVLARKEQSELFDKAMTLFHARDFENAVKLFEKASGGPAREVAHAARVHARMCEQRLGGAAPVLTTAEDYYNYAVALMNRGELDAAVRHFARAASLAPKDDHVYYALALCHAHRGDIGRAHVNLRRAIELQPRNRMQARNDPDFAELVDQSPFRELLYPEQQARPS